MSPNQIFSTVNTFDTRVAQFFADHQNPLAESFFQLVTLAGDWWFVLITLAVLAVLFEHRHRIRWLAALLFAFAGTQASVLVLKFLIARQRPPAAEEFEPLIQGFHMTSSLPSGHATTAMAFYGLLFLLARSRETSWRIRAAFFTVGTALILLIGLSRLYLGVHYPSDILAGYALGAVFFAFAAWLALGALPRKLARELFRVKFLMDKNTGNDTIEDNEGHKK